MHCLLLDKIISLSCEIQTYFDKDDLFRCSYKARRVKVSYAQLCKDFKDNPHYKALGGQQGQQCLKSVVESVKSYNQLLGYGSKKSYQLTKTSKLSKKRWIVSNRISWSSN